MHGRWLAGLGLALGVALATPAGADQEAPDGALKRVLKDTKSLKSYRVAATVEGGMANGADHKITTPRVRERYTADVVGGVARLQDGKAFRPRFGKEGQGAILDGSVWKSMLGTEDGRLMGRLFLRPENYLLKAYAARRHAEWVAPEAGAARRGGPGGAVIGLDGIGGAKAGDGPSGDEKKTRERDGERLGSGARDGEQAPLSHHIRIVAPASEAIEHFTTIVNSGCLGGG